MPKICLFAGTTEGRELSDFLQEQPVELTVCVATEYGSEILPLSDQVNLIQKKLSAAEMAELFAKEKFDLVIDATHPYAVQATENIAAACDQTGTVCRRVLRESSAVGEDAVIVQDISAAADFLDNTEGHILLTTGSNEITGFTRIRNFAERVYARVLPMQSSLEACTAAGLQPSHIIAMQGPFSEEMNIALINSINARWLVTKESGKTGGFDEKASAAGKTGAGLVVIGRPAQHTGCSVRAAIDYLCGAFGFRSVPEVKIIGIGPGSPEFMTQQAVHAIDSADCLIGANRMISAVKASGKNTFTAVDEKIISEYIHVHHEYKKFAVLMSGDSSFFSGTRRLLPLLTGCETEVLPGISSLSYLCAKLKTTCEDIHPVSLHGRKRSIIPDIRRYRRVFVLTGGENSVENICRSLREEDFPELTISVGERLGYTDEQVRQGSVNEISAYSYDPLSVMLIENPNPDAVISHGIPDEAFLRGDSSKGLIPMTKQEIRSVILSKLALTSGAVCWDIGCGTGSIAIEMALQSRDGIVYAIDHDPDAIELSKRNAEHLMAENIIFVNGSAPDCFADLPTPTHVFIGGSSGNLSEIIHSLAARRSAIRITAAAVTLETIAALSAIVQMPYVKESDVISIQAARSRKTGSLHMMQGANPVYIFTMKISGACE